jgi:ribosomal protein RSM22 (predicted rRNA methylase)
LGRQPDDEIQKMNDTLARLNNEILAAHAENNKQALSELYYKAAINSGDNNIEETCFHLTQAYVFALELGLESTEVIHQKLVHFGRES